MAQLPPGSFCWHDLNVNAPNKAKVSAFYKNVLGFDTKEWPTMPGFWMIQAGENNLGGIMEHDPKTQPSAGWVPYIQIEGKVEATRDKAVAKGAKEIVPVSEVPAHGRFNYMKDPTGATFGLWEHDPTVGQKKGGRQT